MSIAKRSYPINVASILKKPILLKSYSAFVKKRYSDELLDFVLCYTTQKKSVHFLYWNFVHHTAMQQINLGANGDNLRDPLDELTNAPGKIDTAALKKAFLLVYSRVVAMLDSNSEIAFSKSTQLEDFALARLKMKPKQVLTTLGLVENKYLPSTRLILLHIAFGCDKEAKKLVASALHEAKGKKPSSRDVVKHMNSLQKAV